MNFSEKIIKESKVYWDKATNNKFIIEMVNGTLNKKVFAEYLIQDYAFIGSFLDLVSYTIAYSETIEQKHKLSTFLSMITSDEDDYFIRSFKALGVKKNIYDNPKKIKFSKSITGFDNIIKKVINSNKKLAYASCITVLMCAEAVYCEWGLNYKDKKTEDFFFNEWILLHNNEYFVNYVKWLKSEVDKFGKFNNDEKEYLSSLFKEFCKLEYQFFDESLNIIK